MYESLNYWIFEAEMDSSINHNINLLSSGFSSYLGIPSVGPSKSFFFSRSKFFEKTNSEESFEISISNFSTNFYQFLPISTNFYHWLFDKKISQLI